MDIEVQKGTFSSWYANKEAKDQQEMEQNEKLKKEVRRLSQAARRSGEWSDKVENSKKGQRVAGLRPDRGPVSYTHLYGNHHSSVPDRKQDSEAEKIVPNEK